VTVEEATIMIRRTRQRTDARCLATALVCLIVLSCAGKSTPVSSGLLATFTPDQPSPADGSVTLQPGDASGRLTAVKVSVKGVPDFFGAAFWITYDPTLVAYYKVDASASFLRDGGADVSVQVDAASTAGQVKVGISRIQDADGGVRGVDVTEARDLLVLSFIAAKASTGSAITFADGHGEVVGSGPPPGNGIAVTWAGGSLSAR